MLFLEYIFLPLNMLRLLQKLVMLNIECAEKLAFMISDVLGNHVTSPNQKTAANCKNVS